MRKPKSEFQKRIPSFTDAEDEYESASSPLRFHSPLRSDDPETLNNSPSPLPLHKPIAPIRSKRHRLRPSLPSPLSRHSQSQSHPPQTTQPEDIVTVAPTSQTKDVESPERIETSPLPMVVVREGERSVGSILRKERKVEVVERVAIAIRVCEVVMCVVSFAVMVTDKTPGWSGDSFDRYKEYRSVHLPSGAHVDKPVI